VSVRIQVPTQPDMAQLNIFAFSGESLVQVEPVALLL
jgi:hypothetical protein